MGNQEQNETMKMQAVIEKYKVVSQEITSLRTMLHNGRYLFILLMGAFIAIIAKIHELPVETQLIIVIWMPLPFLFLHCLHMFESYRYLQSVRYLTNVLEPKIAELAGDKELFMPLPHKAPWLMRAFFQGTSIQLLFFMPAIGTLAWWLYLHKNKPWELYQIITVCFEIAVLVILVWGWARMGREFRGL